MSVIDDLTNIIGIANKPASYDSTNSKKNLCKMR